MIFFFIMVHQRIFFKNMHLFIWLHRVLVEALGIFNCGTQTLSLQRVGSSSLIRDQTQAPALGARSLSYWNTRAVCHSIWNGVLCAIQ